MDQFDAVKTPRKPDQDRSDACLCLLVAMDMAGGKACVVVGKQKSGYIVTSASEKMVYELTRRCIQSDFLKS